jgi:hypothetical protein
VTGIPDPQQPQGPGRSAGQPRLPYPHTRNDCEGCRERDADLHLLGEEHNPPGKRQARYRRACLVEKLLVTAMHGRPREVSPGEPLTVTVALLPPSQDTW